jgi:hypothetical protein
MPVQATTAAMGGFSGEKTGRGVDSQFHAKHIQTRIGFISPSNSIKQFLFFSHEPAVLFSSSHDALFSSSHAMVD